MWKLYYNYIENSVTSIDIHEYTLSIQPENILGQRIEMFVIGYYAYIAERNL